MPRFVVLRHEPGSQGPSELHWDLMLEENETLRTWALDDEPSANTSISASELPPHRKHYLDYEGEVSDNRGSVSRLDQGSYSITRESSNELLIEISGEKLRGHIALRQQEDQRWLVVFDAG